MQNDLKPNDISLYVGIPFCPTRCAYCSFVAQSVEKSFALVEPYLAALFDEIEQAGAMVRSLGLHIKSFYMGGGTPTTLSTPQMARLLDAIRGSFDLSRCLEFTVEGGRPDTLDLEKLKAIRAGARRACPSILRPCPTAFCVPSAAGTLPRRPWRRSASRRRPASTISTWI